jgi:formiminotetrahydrofolate cyclodeaminase
MGVGRGTIEEFLEAVAAPTPTPGGGSVAALAGALSSALSRMVASLAIGKEGYEGVQGDLKRLEVRGRELGNRLLQLVEEDARAYEAVLVALRLPRKTDEERAARVTAMQAAYQRAAEVPLETMAACSEALDLALVAAQKGNRNAITDAGVAALLAEAGIRGSSLNVRINLSALKDRQVRDRIEARLAQIVTAADKVGHDVMALVEGRL